MNAKNATASTSTSTVSAPSMERTIHGINLYAPGGIKTLLAHHRATFGNALMQASDPAPAGDPDGQQGGSQPAQQPAEGAEGTEGPDTDQDSEHGGSKPDNEAAKRRRQLRETEGKLRDTEAERDTLAGTVDALRKQIVASHMPHGAKLNADSLWTAGHNPADMFTAEGTIDAGKLTEAVRETHQKFGVRFGPDPIPGSGTGRGDTGSDGPTWSAVLNKNKR